MKNNFYVFNLTDIIIPFSKPANKYKIGKKNKSIRPGPEKQNSYKKERVYIKKRQLTSVRVILLQCGNVSRSVKTFTRTDKLRYLCVIICSPVLFMISMILDILSTRIVF